MAKICLLFLCLAAFSGCMDGVESLQIIDENSDGDLPSRFIASAGGVNLEHIGIAFVIGVLVGLYVSYRWRKHQ